MLALMVESLFLTRERRPNIHSPGEFFLTVMDYGEGNAPDPCRLVRQVKQFVG